MKKTSEKPAAEALGFLPADALMRDFGVGGSDGQGDL